MPESPDISVVVPVYNEEESLPELTDWIHRVVEANSLSYEVLLIDDGSNDSTWENIKQLSASNPCIRGFRFNRNYGKSAALDTGFRNATGRVVITMDADLQDSPDEIPELAKMIDNGYDLVSGWKKKRRDPISKKVPSRLFNFVTRMLSGIKLHDFNCGLKAYRNEVAKSLDVYGEMHRYLPVIAARQGFTKIGEKVVEHQKRKYGKTKFGTSRFINGFLDLISITFVSRFRRQPMHFFGTLGTLSFLLGFVSIVILVWQKIDAIYISKQPVQREVVEQPLFFISLVAIIIGVQLFLAGFLAEMINSYRNKSGDYIVVEQVG